MSGFFYREPTPEEQAMMDRAEMAHQVEVDAIEALLSARDPEVSLHVKWMLKRLTQDQASAGALASYFYGRIEGAFIAQGVCAECGGKEHSLEEAHALLGEDDNVNNDADAPQPGDTQAPSGDQLYAGYEELSRELKKYRVKFCAIDPMDDRVECVDCGQVYPSFEDRKIKAPDDCHGCQYKAAHG